MKRADFQRIVPRDRDHVCRRPFLTKIDVAPALACHCIPELNQYADQMIRRHNCAEASRSFQGNQFILDVMHLNQARTRRGIFKMHRDGLKDVCTKFVPRIALGENCLAERTGVIAALFGLAV